MTPWVMILLAANVALFVASQAAPAVEALLALVPAYVLVRPWTLLTYMFLHAGLGHLFFNMLSLYFFGPRLEARLGSRHFIFLYLLSGLGGAILSFLLSPYAAVIGASGAVLGVLAAYARFWPDDRIYIWFVLPISARMMVIGLAVYSVWSGFAGPGGGIAHFAHLGGIVVGWLYVVWLGRRRRGKWPLKPERGRAAFDPGRRARWESIRLDRLHEVNRDEAERVLAKLKEGGPGALTPGEREFLDRMSGG